jgi:hypothetical protein
VKEKILRKLINFTFIVVFGWLGWMVGEKIGFMTAYFLSGFACILGFYLSWKIIRRLEE